MKVVKIGNIYIEFNGESIELMIVRDSKALKSMRLNEAESLILLREVMYACRQMLPDTKKKLEIEASEALDDSSECMFKYEKTKDERYRENAEMYAAAAKRYSETASIADKLMKSLDEIINILSELVNRI